MVDFKWLVKCFGSIAMSTYVASNASAYSEIRLDTRSPGSIYEQTYGSRLPETPHVYSSLLTRLSNNNGYGYYLTSASLPTLNTGNQLCAVAAVDGYADFFLNADPGYTVLLESFTVVKSTTQNCSVQVYEGSKPNPVFTDNADGPASAYTYQLPFILGSPADDRTVVVRVSGLNYQRHIGIQSIRFSEAPETLVNGTLLTAGRNFPYGVTRPIIFISLDGSRVRSRVIDVPASGVIPQQKIGFPEPGYIFIPPSYGLSDKGTAKLLGPFPFDGTPIDLGTVLLPNGDVDKDGEIGPSDFALLASAFGASLGDPNFSQDCDLDNDAEVGPSDFSILATYFGSTADTPPGG